MNNLNNKKQNRTSHIAPHTSQKGITLIALIITIIVMLILVGVTVAVALNGGIFGKGEKAAFQTSASTVKEQLELEKASRVMENDGKRLEDYRGIKVGDLSGIDEKTRTEFGNKIVLNKNGDVCYNPANVTDAEEKTWLEEIGIQEYTETNTGNSYTFTIGDLAERGLLLENENDQPYYTKDEFFPDYVSEELKNSEYIDYIGSSGIETYNISCSNSKYLSMFETQNGSGGPNGYAIYLYEGMIVFAVLNENEEPITMENYTEYADLEFTISMPE